MELLILNLNCIFFWENFFDLFFFNIFIYDFISNYYNDIDFLILNKNTFNIDFTQIYYDFYKIKIKDIKLNRYLKIWPYKSKILDLSSLYYRINWGMFNKVFFYSDFEIKVYLSYYYFKEISILNTNTFLSFFFFNIPNFFEIKKVYNVFFFLDNFFFKYLFVFSHFI